MRQLSIVAVLLLMVSGLNAQPSEDDGYSLPESKEIRNSTGLWTGLYTKFRLSERTFYYGEYHFRRRNNFIDEMAQVYLRFGLTYLVNKKFELTGGIVTPLYWAPQNYEGPHKNMVPQYRLWQQALFVDKLGHAKIYHQLRFEQRWKRDYYPNAEYKLSYRFRYKFTTYIPLNSHELTLKTLFLSFYEEIFIQAGKSVVYDHLEDNRLFLGLGYILNDQIQIQAGYMWTFRHDGAPYKYESRHIPRVSLYYNLDFYRNKLNKKKARPIMLDSNF